MKRQDRKIYEKIQRYYYENYNLTSNLNLELIPSYTSDISIYYAISFYYTHKNETYSFATKIVIDNIKLKNNLETIMKNTVAMHKMGIEVYPDIIEDITINPDNLKKIFAITDKFKLNVSQKLKQKIFQKIIEIKNNTQVIKSPKKQMFIKRSVFDSQTLSLNLDRSEKIKTNKLYRKLNGMIYKSYSSPLYYYYKMIKHLKYRKKIVFNDNIVFEAEKSTIVKIPDYDLRKKIKSIIKTINTKERTRKFNDFIKYVQNIKIKEDILGKYNSLYEMYIPKTIEIDF